MNNFLKTTKESLQCQSSWKSVLAVIGNESCDLDSAVSSLVYSYFLYWIDKKEAIDNSTSDSRIFIPLLNIAKQDLPIKTEVVYLLNKHDINIENMIFVEELDFNSLVDSLKQNLNIVLVDHHIMEDKFSYLIPHVSQILDHRPKDTENWKYPDSIKAVMSNVGSCTTLVCAEILNNNRGKDFLIENAEASLFLYGTIVLDTANFSPSADKAKPLDFQMAEKLEEILGIKNRDLYRKDVFDNLLTARIDYSSLNSFQLLRKDLKIVNNIPVPGLPLLVMEYLKMNDVVASMKKFCNQHAIKTIVVMGLAIINNEVKRDLCVFTLGNCSLFDRIVQSLKEASNPSLSLEQDSCNLEHCVYFKQNNIKASRKQIIPILKTL